MNETTKAPRREFGHIYVRGAIFWVRYRVDGRTYRESTGSTDRRRAEKMLARKEAEVGIPGAFVSPDVKRTRFEDLAQMIRDDYRVRELRSGDLLENSLRHLAEKFARVRASTITPARLTAYVRARLDDPKPPALRTIENELNALKHAMRLAKKDGKLASVPEFPKLAKPQPREGFFEPEEFGALLGELPEPLRAPTEFAYITGWRRREVLNLTWDRVDWNGETVRLEGSGTKNKEGRTFPFKVMPRLKALLEEQEAKRRQAQRRMGSIIRHVFHRSGQPIKDFYEAWANACERASKDQKGAIVRPQLIGRIFHDLRRTAVRNLVRAGVPEQIAMKLSGHKTRAVFDRYDIVNERDLSEAVAKLATYHEALGTKAVSR